MKIENCGLLISEPASHRKNINFECNMLLEIICFVIGFAAGNVSEFCNREY